MTEIGRRMQTQQEETQINQKDRHSNGCHRSLNCYQGYHGKLSTPSIDKEAHQAHLYRGYIRGTDNATSKTNADIT